MILYVTLSMLTESDVEKLLVISDCLIMTLLSVANRFSDSSESLYDVTIALSIVISTDDDSKEPNSVSYSPVTNLLMTTCLGISPKAVKADAIEDAIVVDRLMI